MATFSPYLSFTVQYGCFRKSGWRVNGTRLFGSFQWKNFLEQWNALKGSLVFSVGMFQTEIRTPFLQSLLWYQFQGFLVSGGCNLPVLNFAYYMPNPWTDRNVHVSGKQPISQKSWREKSMQFVRLGKEQICSCVRARAFWSIHVEPFPNKKRLLSFVSGYTTNHKGGNENRVVSSNCTSGGQQTGYKVSIRIQRAKWNGNSGFSFFSFIVPFV